MRKTRTLEGLGQRWRKAKPGALAQDGEYRPGRASSPARPGQGCGVSWLAPTQHNGLFGKVRPVAALKLRLVAAPLRAQPFAPFGFTKPPLCLAPLRPARAAWRTCAKPHAGSHWPARYRLRRNRRGFCPGAGARSVELAPAHPVGPGACAPLARAGRWPVRPQGGSLHPRRWGAVALAGAVPVAGVGHGSLAHRRASNPNSLHGAARRA